MFLARKRLQEIKEKDKLIYKLIALIHIVTEFSKDNFRADIIVYNVQS